MKMTVNQMVRWVAAVVALAAAFGFAGSAGGECRFVAALKEGRQQKIVCYGTSHTVLSSNWVDGLQETLDLQFPIGKWQHWHWQHFHNGNIKQQFHISTFQQPQDLRLLT